MEKDYSEIAEKNGLVAAQCCRWCKHFDIDLTDGGLLNAKLVDACPCRLLKIPTFSTDVCSHFDFKQYC